MDFSNRSTQPQPVAPSAHVASAASQPGSNKKNNRDDKNQWFRIGITILAGAIVALLIALAVFFAGNNNSSNEYSYVDTNKLQAVFLETGQVYFGNLKALNDKYAVLTNIFYLQTSSGSSTSSTSSSNSSVSLVKLGCELHMPYDQMVISQSQITFFENLQSDGQVAKAVATFEKENPNGQKCADQSSSSAATSGAAVQSANTSTTTPTTTSTTSATKP
jgi:hypothetical protein